MFPGNQRSPVYYKTDDDPGELHNIAADGSAQDFLKDVSMKMTAWMKRCLDWRNEFQLHPGNRMQDRLSPEARAEMEALGYIEAGPENGEKKNGKFNRIIRPKRKLSDKK